MSDEPSLHHVVVAVWLFAVPWSDAPSLTKPSGMARTLRVVCGSLLHWLWLTSESRNRHGGILLVLARVPHGAFSLLEFLWYHGFCPVMWPKWKG